MTQPRGDRPPSHKQPNLVEGVEEVSPWSRRHPMLPVLALNIPVGPWLELDFIFTPIHL